MNTLARRIAPLAAAALVAPLLNVGVAAARQGEGEEVCTTLETFIGDLGGATTICKNTLPQLILFPGVGVERDDSASDDSVDVTFVAALVPPPNGDVEFTIELGDDTADSATPGDDYDDAPPNPLTFRSDDPVKTFTVDVLEDDDGLDGLDGGDEPVETFTVTLQTDDLGEDHNLLSASTQGIIVDDDYGPDEVLSVVPPQVIVTPAVAMEGNDLKFTAVMVPPPMGDDEFTFDVVAEGGEVVLNDLEAGPEDFGDPSRAELTFDENNPTEDFTVPAETDDTLESVIELFDVRLDGPKGEAQGIPSTGGVGVIVDADTDKDSDGDLIPDVADDLTDADENDDGDGLPNAVDEGPTDLDKDDENGQVDAIENLDSNNDGIPDVLWDGLLEELLESTGNDRFDDDCGLGVSDDGDDDDEGCDLDADQDGDDPQNVPDPNDIITIAFRAFDFALEELPDPVGPLVMDNVYRAVLVPLFDHDHDGDVDAEDMERDGDDNFTANDILAVVNETAALIQAGLTPVVSLSGPDGPVDEGNDDTTPAVFTVSLSAPSLLPVKVDVATQDGTAEAGGDYSDYDPVPDPETVTFGPLVTEQTVTVHVVGDGHAEADETFDVVISNARTEDIPEVGDPVPPSGSDLLATIDPEKDRASAIIKDNNGPAPVLTVSDVTVGEPAEGDEPVAAEVTVSLDTAPTQNVTVDVETEAGTATADDNDDYDPAPVPADLTFAPGEMTKGVSITVNPDGLDERNETFEVTLTDERNAVVSSGSSGTGTVTIIDSDDMPVVSVGDAEIAEDDDEFGALKFPVTLSKASGREVAVHYRTTDAGTATPVGDYETESGTTLTIPAGDAAQGAPVFIEVPIVNDDIYEHDQTVALQLDGATNATVGTADATGTIVDDEDPPELSVADEVSVEEPADAEFTVTRTFPTGTGSTEVASTVDVSTVELSDEAAEEGVDYEPLPEDFSVTLPPGGLTDEPFTVTVNDDNFHEDDESFGVELSDTPTDAVIADGGGTGTATITDNDGLPDLTIEAISPVTEGDGGPKSVVVDVTLAPASGKQVTVDVSTAEITDGAEPGSDYDPVPDPQTLTFTPGETTQQVTVDVFGDTLDEHDETFEVVLSNPDEAGIDVGVRTVTIEDNDAAPTLTIDDADPMDGEGDEGMTPVTFDVHLSQESGKQVTVDVATADGTATAPDDYEAIDPPETLTFAPGETTQQVTVNVVGDEHAEGEEQFTVELSNPDNAGIVDDNDSATVTIPNDDGPRPKLSVDDLEVDEVDGTASVTVTLVKEDDNVTQNVSVDVSTVDGTATSSGDNPDYGQKSETLVFDKNDGPGTQTFDVTLEQDALYEPGEPETFEVRLSKATNAEIADDTAVVTLVDSDDPPTLSVVDTAPAVTEGDSGTKTALVPVTLDGESAADVQVSFATADGSAKAGEDYETVQGTITLPPGDNGGTTIAIPIVGDTLDEDDKTFSLVLSDPVDATIGDGTAVVTIRDDDPLPALSVSDVSVTEGDSGTTTAEFTVSLSPASGRTVTVSASTRPGSATAGDDYASTGGKITFEPGATSVVVPVTVGGDTTHERDETFRLGLSSPANATIADPIGVATIVNDDEPPPPPPEVEGVTVEKAPVNSQSTPDGRGYWIATSEGDVFGFGNAERFGSLRGAVATADIGAPVVELTATPEGDGYWLLDDQGGVHTFGTAPFFGSLPGRVQQGLVGPARVTGMARTPTGDGYVVLDEQGGIHTFGDATFHGSIPARRAAGVPVGFARATSIAVTPSGDGYVVLDEQGGIHTFGDATFLGSIPGLRASGVSVGQTRFVSLATTPDGGGYWILDEHGGVHTFGNAKFHGSIPGLVASGQNIGNAATASIEPAPGGEGYWIFDEVGGVFTFGSARFAGSVPGLGRG